MRYAILFSRGNSTGKKLKDVGRDLSAEQLRFYWDVLSGLPAAQDNPETTCNPRALLGVPGTGKARVLAALLAEGAKELNVAICTLTGALAEDYRQLFVDADRVTVDTFDGSGLTLAPTSRRRTIYSTMVDEIGYLGRSRFEFAVRAWALAGRACNLIFAGVFAQQDPPDKSGAANDSPWWQQIMQIKTSRALDTIDRIHSIGTL